MTAALAIPCAVYALILAVVTVVSAIRRRRLSRAVKAGVAVLEVGLILQAVSIGVAAVGGARAEDPASHVAYLVTSILIVPVAFVVAGRDSPLWGGMVVAVALAAVVVVVVRMQATWGPHGGA